MVWTYHELFICSSVVGDLGFPLFGCDAAMNIPVQVPSWTYIFISLEYILGSMIPETYVNSVEQSGKLPDCYPK